MTPGDRSSLLKMAKQGLEQKVMCERLGRASSTVHDWLRKTGIHNIWASIRRVLVYKRVKVGHRATYMKNEMDREINSVKLESRFHYPKGRRIPQSTPIKLNPRLSKGELRLAFVANGLEKGLKTPLKQDMAKGRFDGMKSQRRSNGGLRRSVNYWTQEQTPQLLARRESQQEIARARRAARAAANREATDVYSLRLAIRAEMRG